MWIQISRDINTWKNTIWALIPIWTDIQIWWPIRTFRVWTVYRLQVVDIYSSPKTTSTDTLPPWPLSNQSHSTVQYTKYKTLWMVSMSIRTTTPVPPYSFSPRMSSAQCTAELVPNSSLYIETWLPLKCVWYPRSIDLHSPLQCWCTMQNYPSPPLERPMSSWSKMDRNCTPSELHRTKCQFIEYGQSNISNLRKNEDISVHREHDMNFQI